MVEGGNILRICNYDFEDGKSPNKDKFLIVLLNINGISIVAPLTTSKDYLPDHYKNQRCVKDEPNRIHCYYIPSNIKIGISGFYFPKDTFIHIHTSNLSNKSIKDFTAKYIDSSKAELKDKLTNKEYSNLLYCVYKSSFVSKKLKKMIEPIIEGLENTDNKIEEGSEFYGRINNLKFK